MNHRYEKSVIGEERMSFVVAIMKSGYSIVAGDTQLNDDNGPIEATGIKVFPVDRNIVAGFTGNYLEGRESIDEFISAHKAKKLFSEKAQMLSELLRRRCKDGNAILVETCITTTKYALFSSKDDWTSDIQVLSGVQVKALFPPDVHEENYYKNITSPDNLKPQVINCIRAVSRDSASVNDKIYGIEMDGYGLKQFTEGIEFKAITMSYGYLT